MVNQVEQQGDVGYYEYNTEVAPAQSNGAQSQEGANVQVRNERSDAATEANANEAKPTLEQPTVDPGDDAQFYSSVDPVLEDLKKLAEQGVIDPEVLIRFQQQAEQVKSLLNNGVGEGNLEAFLIALLSMMNELRTVLKEIGITDLQTQNEMTQEKHDEQLEKLMKSLESMEKAKKSGVFSEVFGWVAFVATAVFMVATIVGTGGLSTPVVLAGLGMALSLLQQMDEKLFDNAMLKGVTGGDEKAMMIMTYAVLAASIALMLASVAASYRAATAASTKAGASGANGANGAQKSIDIVAETDKWEKVMNSVIRYSGYTQFGSTMGREAANIHTAVHERDASHAEADLKTIEALLRSIDEMISVITDMLKTVHEAEIASAQFVSDMIKILKDTKNHTARTLA